MPELPTPLIADEPVKVRFSRFSPSVKDADDWTISVPALAASVIVSPPSVMYVSLPRPPMSVSVPVPPLRVLFPLLPVPLIAYVPVRDRFSRFVPRV